MKDDTTQWTDAPVGRRRVLGATVAGLAGLAGAAALPGGLAAAPPPRPRVRTPEQALRALMEGNRRFVQGRTTAPHRDLERVRGLAEGQTPFASILGCADSRVPVELVFDQGFGDLFVCRAAGNVVTPELIGSLEFGTAVLGSQLVMVLGHTACGAVKAAASGQPVPGQISALYRHIRPAVDAAGGDVEAAVRENVRIQARLLRDASPVVAELVREGKLAVVGGVYHLDTGEVRPVEV